MKFVLPALLALALPLTACHHGNREAMMEKMISWKIEKVSNEINATDAQRQQLTQIKTDALAQFKPLAENGKSFRATLFTEFQNGTLKADEVHKFIDTQGDAMQVSAHKLADELIAFQSSLTAEQRTKLAKHMEKARKHFRD